LDGRAIQVLRNSSLSKQLMDCPYKKQEVKTPSSGTPTISLDFLRGILPGLLHTPFPGALRAVLGSGPPSR
jgi:hypothetical protein